MDFKEWEPYYREILSDFGFDKAQDEYAGQVLLELLKNKNLATEGDLRGIIGGKKVVVVGGSKDLEDQLKDDPSEDIIIAADGTTSVLLKHNLIPHIIVTDLDGVIEDQVAANSKGALAVIHAHGDNIEHLKSWTPRFKGMVLGTVQCMPHGILKNFGGFTDGDRGVFLAHHFTAASIMLIGFDFENVGDKKNCDIKTKKAKLQWAKRLISVLGIKEGT